MSNPQQPELARSRKTPAQDQDAVAGVLDGQPDVGADAPRGPVPADNQPGHHPAEEQDKPDLDAFAAKLGTMEPEEREEYEERVEQEQKAEQGATAGRRGTFAAVAGIAATVVAVVLAVFAGRRRRRSRR